MYPAKNFFGKTFGPVHLFQMDVEDNFPQMISKTPGERINVIIVGAWHGDEIRSFLKFDNVRIWAFEPNPANFTYLKNRYGNDPRVTCFDLACGESEGTLPLYEADLTGNDSLLPIREGADIRTKKVHMVEVKRLDSMPELDIPIDLLWIDAQGYELPILKGAQNLIKNARSMFLEINEPDEKYAGATKSGDLERFLDENGFYNAHEETEGPNEGGNAFFLKKDIKTDLFSVGIEKRIDASLERRKRAIMFSNNPLYPLLSTLIPAPLRAFLKKALAA